MSYSNRFTAFTLIVLIMGSLGMSKKPAESAGEQVAVPSSNLKVSSPAFKNGEEIPDQYSCLGSNVNPPLTFHDIPEGTRSFAIIVENPDAKEGNWVHWLAYNLDPAAGGVAENTTVAYQALNDFGRYMYQGPCPEDETPRRYYFRVYALNAIIPVDEGMAKPDLVRAMAGHIVGQTEMYGIFSKPVW